MAKKLIRIWIMVVLLSVFAIPANAVNSNRGTRIANDETGIADKELYSFLLEQAKQDQLYTNDLADLEELTITNYNYDIKSLAGLRYLQMPKIKVMNLAIDTLNQIDDVLGFRSLEELNIYDLAIKQLPDRISQLVNLKILLIEGGSINQLPANLYDMATLRSLVLKNLKLTELSPQLSKLLYLEELVLDHVGVSVLPSGFYQLRNLRILKLNGLQLKILPDSFEELSRLESLHLESNSFTEIPDVLFTLPNLQYLSLKNNELLSVDAKIQSLHRLREFDVSNNKLTTLPLEVINLPSLRILELADNNWDCLAPEFQYLTLTNVTDIHGFYGIRVCGAAITSTQTNIQPLLIFQGESLYDGAVTSQEVVIESDQVVNFVINGSTNVASTQAMIFSTEGTYEVSGISANGISSNTLRFTIDKTNPVIKITNEGNRLGIYHTEVAIDASEDGYFIINGAKQNNVSRLLVLSDYKSYKVLFMDRAGNESNVLDLVLQAKSDEVPENTNDEGLLYIYLLIAAILMGAGSFYFLKQGVDEED